MKNFQLICTKFKAHSSRVQGYRQYVPLQSLRTLLCPQFFHRLDRKKRKEMKIYPSRQTVSHRSESRTPKIQSSSTWDQIQRNRLFETPALADSIFRTNTFHKPLPYSPLEIALYNPNFIYIQSNCIQEDRLGLAYSSFMLLDSSCIYSIYICQVSTADVEYSN